MIIRLASALLCLVTLTGPVFPAPKGERWQMQFYYDKTGSSLSFTDIQCPAANRCIASGAVDKAGSRKGALLLTRDGGEHWTEEPFSELPLSMFFLNDSLGWMVTEHGIWQTRESGLHWTKLKGLKGLQQVAFVSETHGFAAGDKRSLWETSDGGKSWNKLAAGNLVKEEDSDASFDSVIFSGPNHGLVLGSSEPPRTVIPTWMDAASLRSQRTWTGKGIVLETQDGGAHWNVRPVQRQGTVSQAAFTPGGRMLALIQVFGSPQFPSSLIDLSDGAVLYRWPDRTLRDIAVLPGGDIYLAGEDLPGATTELPVPGRLRILRGHIEGNQSSGGWLSMNVDYRAVCLRPVLATANGDVWVATDTGMILKLIHPGKGTAAPSR